MLTIGFKHNWTNVCIFSDREVQQNESPTVESELDDAVNGKSILDRHLLKSDLFQLTIFALSDNEVAPEELDLDESPANEYESNDAVEEGKDHFFYIIF